MESGRYFPNPSNRHRRRCAMSSELQIEANRLNGLKYGLYAETLILPGEDPAEFDAMLDRLDAEHQPATPTEEIFVSQLAMASWRRARVQRMEAAFYRNEHKARIANDNRRYIALDP